MKPSERMQILSDYLGIKPIPLARMVGLNRQRIRDIIVNDGQMVHPDIATAICTKFPTLSYDWIIKGTGEMLIPNEENEEIDVSSNTPIVNELLAIVHTQQNQIDTLTEFVANMEDKQTQLLEELKLQRHIMLQTLCHKEGMPTDTPYPMASEPIVENTPKTTE